MQEVKESADVVIDFSNPSLLDGLLEYGIETNTALVIATTGFDDCQKKKIQDASKKCPVFFTYNMSIGINLLANLAKKAVQVLGNDFDIEIVEAHHNQKIDAPSGTALMLADAITEEIDRPMKYEYDRHNFEPLGKIKRNFCSRRSKCGSIYERQTCRNVRYERACKINNIKNNGSAIALPYFYTIELSIAESNILLNLVLFLIASECFFNKL